MNIWFENADYYMPHSHCVLGDPVVIWLDFVGNIMVGLAYLIIPALLARLIVGMWWQLKAFRKLILHGAVFVLLCGSTHFIHAWNWSGTAYAEQAVLEILTGVISMLFVSHLFLFIRRRAWEK